MLLLMMHKGILKILFGIRCRFMAQTLKSINLVAPAFKGINTEDSPLAQDPSFAEIADNAIIDKRGRIAARKGNRVTTEDKTELSSDRVHVVHWFYDDDDNEKLFSMGNNKIMSGDVTLVDETPATYTITANNWKTVNFNNAAYFFQRGHEPLIYTVTGGVGTLETFTSYNGSAFPVQFHCHEALAAYGRLWITGNSSQNQIIYWSDLLIGTDYSGGSSGSIDVSKAWPDGYDEIRALAAHNNLLIIFGNHSILIYQGASSPATMSLIDTVAGVGCVCRNSVQHIGTDVLFVSHSGLRSFGRTIQEKSMPLSDLSGNIKTEFISSIEIRSQPTSSIYSPENSFYLITFFGESLTYCFDLKGRLENNSYRVTRWPTSSFSCFERKPDGTLLTGSRDGIGEYDGYSDNLKSYTFKYYSPGLTFGDPSRIKILKKLRPTLVGANSATVSLKWAYDLNTSYSSSSFTLGNQDPAYYSEDEYPVYSELSGYSITSTFVSDPNGVTFPDGSVGYYEVNKYLGAFTTAPTVGSGGGALLDGDSYYNQTDKIYYVRISGAWVDLSTLTPSSISEYTGGEQTTRRLVNTTGTGTIITIGLETEINGSALSLQEINVQALIGKIL